MKFRHLLLLIALIVPILICSNALFAQPLVTGVPPNRGSTGGGTFEDHGVRHDIYMILLKNSLAFDFESEGAIFLLIKL